MNKKYPEEISSGYFILLVFRGFDLSLHLAVAKVYPVVVEDILLVTEGIHSGEDLLLSLKLLCVLVHEVRTAEAACRTDSEEGAC